MASIKPSSRYSSMDSRSSSTTDPLSSSSSSSSAHNKKTLPASSKALVSAKTTPQGAPNLGSLLRKLVDKRSTNNQKQTPAIVPPYDPIAKEMKKAGKGGSNFSALSKKLFQKGDKKALTEVKTNTRTLAMVLRSERELLVQNKENEDEIAQLRLLLEDKNREVEKLKDLCLKQREEIKGLKDAVLFPEETKCELQELVEKQKSELKQAKQVIPALQTQVSSLTAHLQSLARDLAQVKAEKYKCTDDVHFNSSPRGARSRTSMLNDHFPAMEDCSSGTAHPSEFGSPDGGGMLSEDFNPCLTPRFSKQISMDYDDGCESPSGGGGGAMLSHLCFKTSGKMKATKIYQSESEEEENWSQGKLESEEEENWSQGKLVSQNLFASP